MPIPAEFVLSGVDAIDPENRFQGEIWQAYWTNTERPEHGFFFVWAPPHNAGSGAFLYDEYESGRSIRHGLYDVENVEGGTTLVFYQKSANGVETPGTTLKFTIQQLTIRGELEIAGPEQRYKCRYEGPGAPHIREENDAARLHLATPTPANRTK